MSKLIKALVFKKETDLAKKVENALKKGDPYDIAFGILGGASVFFNSIGRFGKDYTVNTKEELGYPAVKIITQAVKKINNLKGIKGKGKVKKIVFDFDTPW